MCNHTQNDAIWELIALFLTNQIAGNTIDFKMNVITTTITQNLRKALLRKEARCRRINRDLYIDVYGKRKTLDT